MIPPLAPGQSEDKQNMVSWKNTFNMRQVTLFNIAASSLGVKNGTKIANHSHRRQYSITSPGKSLDLVRRNIQAAVNKDIDTIIKKYIDKFFQPAIANIRNNLGQESINDDHIRDLCKHILEEAKIMYTSKSRENSPYECSQSEADSENSFVDLRHQNLERMSPLFHQPLKRKDIELDLEHSALTIATKRPKHKTLSSYYNDNLGCKFSLKRDGPKWNPDRIKRETLFIMGSRANKVLGYGQTRGRLYVRHPNLLRYCGDQEDKEWLQSQNLLPANGGKIYIMLLEDIKELTESDEYKNNPNLQLQELQGFEAPEFLTVKIKNYLEYIKSEKKLMAVLDIDDNSSETPPPNITITNDSILPSPSDSLESNVENIWKTSQLRQQIDYPNMSSDMSSLSSSVISSILSGNYTGISGFKNDTASF
ncbi:deoxynucleotidyltransferase terminal-interacting protein 1 [Rhynchophorus ferrugineus]|uniref:deoxynucleotidyltransferase terminal-interacting protein 1 n=1 Tax=Rhynchophorus ferrugineus TaxID=354439 RepID=UPI003FCE60AD